MPATSQNFGKSSTSPTIALARCSWSMAWSRRDRAAVAGAGSRSLRSCRCRKSLVGQQLADTRSPRQGGWRWWRRNRRRSWMDRWPRMAIGVVSDDVSFVHPGRLIAGADRLVVRGAAGAHCPRGAGHIPVQRHVGGEYTAGAAGCLPSRLGWRCHRRLCGRRKSGPSQGCIGRWGEVHGKGRRPPRYHRLS